MNRSITESCMTAGLSAIYCVGASLAAYYTWPWGFIFFGPTIGAVIQYSYSVRKKSNSAYDESTTVEVSVQTDPISESVEGKDNSDKMPSAPPPPIIHAFRPVFAIAPSAPPGGIALQIEGQPSQQGGNIPRCV